MAKNTDILILNSYHKGLSWSDEVIRGIEEQFNTYENSRFNLFIEYLDAKRYRNINADKTFFDYLKQKYERQQFRLIIANDDAALNFLEQYKEKLFGDIPVVFTGANIPRVFPKDYTGFKEEIEVASNLNLIQKLHPDLQNLYIIVDNSITGRTLKKEFLNQLNKGDYGFDYYFFTDYTYEDLLTQISELSSDGVIFLGIFTEDAKGHYLSFAEVIEDVNQSASLPIYSAWDFYLGRGIIGGKIIAGFQYGKEAARIALQIIEGTEVNSIPMRAMTSQYMFDHNELKEHNISLRKLPQNSEVINGPYELFKENKTLFITLLALIILMLLVILILLRYNQIRRQRIAEQTEYLRKIENINEDLKGAKQKAQEANKLKTSFLANISHEVRTPLNAIIGFSRLITDNRNIEQDTYEKYHSLLKINSDLLLNLINDIIDLSKIETNQLNLSYKDFDLNALMNSLFDYALQEKKKADKSKLEILLDLGLQKDSFYIRTDESRLRQVLMNLIHNSIKFTFTGKIEMGYRLKGGQLLFYVKDTGIGLSEQESRYIFDSFRQGEEGNTKKFGGAGLGLTLSRGIVENLNGKIWCEPNGEEGTVFYVQVPFIPSSENKIRKPGSFAAQMEEKYNWNGKQILVVEDSFMAYELITKLLNGTGAKFMLEVDGHKAIEQCRKNKDIDLVLMDIQLPFMDGYEATREIKKIRPELPIIAQTANAMLDDRKKALDAGCEEYVAKPLDRMELAEKINKLLFMPKEDKV